MSFVRLLFVSLLAFTLAPVGWAQTDLPRDPAEFFFNQTFGDFSEELERAKEEGKQGILIMFEMDECPYCHFMKTHILNQVEVQDYYREHFLSFPVDIEGDVEISDFQGQPTTMKAFGATYNRKGATPFYQFFDLAGKPLKRGKLAGFTPTKEEFLLLGRYVAEGEHEKTSFTRYKRDQRK